MDDLTRERHPYPIPWRERTARPTPRPRKTCGQAADTALATSRRRTILCGTDDLDVLLQGGDTAELARVGERRVVDAIRRWAA